MSYKCYVCGKGSSSGNTVSHSNKATKRLFRPNLQALRIIVDGKKTKEYVKNYVDTKVPDPPVANGDYVLQVTVNNGSVSYSWVSTANWIVDNQNSGN